MCDALISTCEVDMKLYIHVYGRYKNDSLDITRHVVLEVESKQDAVKKISEFKSSIDEVFLTDKRGICIEKLIDNVKVE